MSMVYLHEKRRVLSLRCSVIDVCVGSGRSPSFSLDPQSSFFLPHKNVNVSNHDKTIAQTNRITQLAEIYQHMDEDGSGELELDELQEGELAFVKWFACRRCLQSLRRLQIMPVERRVNL